MGKATPFQCFGVRRTRISLVLYRFSLNFGETPYLYKIMCLYVSDIIRSSIN
ncbi:hypothetical protein RhiirC2_333099 [Rhizophagus irregularis]|uniref:Uncharacterized protein n=1 Tax=Rhizophagus irregularis TaxID=588596 RepID=A0A2N1M9X0_9GLOM|nr:hypothetical protein RhiirC2_333099 [Rhizophagus irregularis]